MSASEAAKAPLGAPWWLHTLVRASEALKGAERSLRRWRRDYLEPVHVRRKRARMRTRLQRQSVLVGGRDLPTQPAWFDEVYYAAQLAGHQVSCPTHPWAHYLQVGAAAGLRPHPHLPSGWMGLGPETPIPWERIDPELVATWAGKGVDPLNALTAWVEGRTALPALAQEQLEDLHRLTAPRPQVDVSVVLHPGAVEPGKIAAGLNALRAISPACEVLVDEAVDARLLPAGVCFRSALEAQGRFVLYLHLGVVLAPTCLDRLLETFDRVPGAASVSPATHTVFGVSWPADPQGAPALAPQDPMMDGHLRPIREPLASCRLVRREGGTEHLLQPSARVVCLDVAEPIPPHAVSTNGLRILVVDAGLPDPNQDAGSVATCEILRLLVNLGHQVTLLAHQHRGTLNAALGELQGMGVAIRVPSGHESGLPWVGAHGHAFDVMLVFRHALAESYFRIAQRHCPNVRLVFHAADLHHLRMRRQAEVLGSRLLACKAELVAAKELAVIQHAGCTIVHSDLEAAWITTHAPGAPVVTFPWVAQVQPEGPGFEAREGLLFVGSFRHDPNRDAVHWFVQEVLPRVNARLPDVRLHVVGSGMPKEIRALEGPNLVAHGFVEHLGDIYDRCRVSVSPLRFGAGIKGKVIQALAHGLPSVISPMAAEGMAFIQDRGAVICESAEAFAEAIIRRYTDPALWEQQARAARDVVAEAFSDEAGKAHLRKVLALVRAESEAV